MTDPVILQHVTPHEPHHEQTLSKTILGFWVYIMTDCLLFATLFATYAVLHQNTFGGPTSQDLFNLSDALIETFVLLVSSFTCGLAVLSAYNLKKKQVIFWFILTGLLGITFLTIELREFAVFVHEGNSWQRSAFLSSYFTLVGTHGLHISVGLLWMGVLIGQILFFGINSITLRRLTCLGIFWHFLDVVWIFIFSVVYLMGVS